MPTSYRPGQSVTVRDCRVGRMWSATYKGDNCPRDKTGVIIEINGSRTRAELRNIRKV